MNAINEYAEIIKGIYRSYCQRPEWYKIQLLLQNAFKLGVAVGEQRIFNSRDCDKGE